MPLSQHRKNPFIKKSEKKNNMSQCRSRSIERISFLKRLIIYLLIVSMPLSQHRKNLWYNGIIESH